MKTGDTPICDGLCEPAKYITMHIVPRKHFLNYFLRNVSLWLVIDKWLMALTHQSSVFNGYEALRAKSFINIHTHTHHLFPITHTYTHTQCSITRLATRI